MISSGASGLLSGSQPSPLIWSANCTSSFDVCMSVCDPSSTYWTSRRSSSSRTATSFCLSCNHPTPSTASRTSRRPAGSSQTTRPSLARSRLNSECKYYPPKVLAIPLFQVLQKSNTSRFTYLETPKQYYVQSRHPGTPSIILPNLACLGHVQLGTVVSGPGGMRIRRYANPEVLDFRNTCCSIISTTLAPTFPH